MIFIVKNNLLSLVENTLVKNRINISIKSHAKKKKKKNTIKRLITMSVLYDDRCV